METNQPNMLKRRKWRTRGECQIRGQTENNHNKAPDTWQTRAGCLGDRAVQEQTRGLRNYQPGTAWDLETSWSHEELLTCCLVLSPQSGVCKHGLATGKL